jgi:hypothetical protein
VDNGGGGGGATGIHLPCSDILCHRHELQRFIIVVIVDVDDAIIVIVTAEQ